MHSERIALQYPLMVSSVAGTVKARVAKKPGGAFIRSSDFPGSSHAVDCALSRLVFTGDLLRIRKGLYWKGPKTPLGIAPPRPLAVGLHMAGPGSGPAGYAAAAALGLTTQVPSTVEIAVPGRPPKPPTGVRFTLRQLPRRDLRLRPHEVALIEVLRDWPDTVEVEWDTMAASARDLLTSGSLRPDRITKAIEAEHSPAARERWHHLRPSITT